MAGIDRRKFLQSSGAGGLAGILASGRAPAFAQTTTLHWLRLGDFVPASDTLLRRELLPEAEKALGLKITLETINGNELQARIASSIQSGSGADLIHAMHNWPHLYAESLVDVSDVAEEIAKEQGGFYDIFPAIAKSEKGWLAVPWAALGILLCYRKSWFDEIGVTKFPDTWESYRAAGKLLKAKGRPIGQTLGHAYNDAPAFTYPYFWSFGGQELEADGKTVALNSKATLESVKFMAGFWKDAHDEGGLAWDDSNNNRAFLGGTICSTSNAASIYIEALRKPDQYRTEKGAPLKDDILHAPYPNGPGGAAPLHPPQTHMLMGYSKNQKAAKDLLRWASSRKVFEKWFVSQKGFSIPAAREWSKHPVWNEDPVMAPFRDVILTARAPGWPGPSNRKAAEVVSKYIITDMYAKAVQGMPAEDAVKWAHTELMKVYA
ncbi:MAG: multiple sugar transport system substrate-binding protein [Hyphomicrobiales bacterium]|jgi:multiple sugar transport system substrate-binding protein|nr:multiple sugar transport system substrate-binding protein [Hyphomicrobiales bacterium]